MPKRKGVFSGMPSLNMTILNLLMASGGEYASILDRVHCIHYLTDFLTDFSHLRNTSLWGDAFPQNIQLCFDPTSPSLRKSSTTSKPSLLEKSDWDESKPIASVFIWKQALTTIPLNQQTILRIVKAKYLVRFTIIYDIWYPSNKWSKHLPLKLSHLLCTEARRKARLPERAKFKHIIFSRAREHIKLIIYQHKYLYLSPRTGKYQQLAPQIIPN